MINGADFSLPPAHETYWTGTAALAVILGLATSALSPGTKGKVPHEREPGSPEASGTRLGLTDGFTCSWQHMAPPPRASLCSILRVRMPMASALGVTRGLDVAVWGALRKALATQLVCGLCHRWLSSSCIYG